MIRFHEKPFLEYLLELLRDQGFQRVLLLLGYLPEVVRDYFGNGSRWGIRVDYSVTDVENDTGTRVRMAREQIDPLFLFMYCDNYWPMNFNKVWAQYESKPSSAQLTVYDNQDRYTRDNILVGTDGVVVRYDRSRKQEGLRGVDIGFAILRKELLDMIPEENVSFEQSVYPRLVEQGQMTAFVTSHRYYSVGSLERLDLTREFLERRPAIILDRDGVLNRKMPEAQYVRSWRDWEWISGSKDAIAMFKQAGYRVIIVSNQAGIARGVMSEADLSEIHRQMIAEVEAAGGGIDAIYVCPHGWDDACACRKPKPGMLFAAQRDFSLDLSRISFIGDDDRDQLAADAAGCRGLKVTESVRLIDRAREILVH